MRKCIERALIASRPAADKTAGTYTFCFKAEEPVFQGHFPGHPLLPGVFQIEMARMAAEWLTGATLAIALVRKARFTRPLLPGEEIILELVLTRNADQTTEARASFSVAGESAGQSVVILS
jgi:3-hydroxyacyl-[acyl-carrier-protein] dehydratase